MKVKNAAPTAPAIGPRRATHWVSRNSEAGALSPEVDIWLLRPTRVIAADRVFWMLLDGATVMSPAGPIPAHHGRLPALEAALTFGTIPDDDLQLVRNGEEHHVSPTANPS